MSKRWAVRVTWSDSGEDEYLLQGIAGDESRSAVAMFLSKRRAEKQAEFMRIGLDDGEAVVAVVPFPASAPGER